MSIYIYICMYIYIYIDLYIDLYIYIYIYLKIIYMWFHSIASSYIYMPHPDGAIGTT